MKKQTIISDREELSVTECDFILRLITYFSEEKLPYEVVGENRIEVCDGSNRFIVTINKKQKSF